MLDPHAEKDSIGTLVGRLIQDGKAYARAEIDYVKALAGHRAREAKSAIIFLVAGLVLLHGALIALFVGALLSLEPLVGPFWAMVIVVVVASAIGGILAKIGLTHLRQVKTGPDLPGQKVAEP